MKKIVIGICIVLAIVIASLLIVASTKPDIVRVERSLSVNAQQEKIAVLINNFHNWILWSPYEKLDPMMSRRYGGPEQGRGAIYKWAGNSKAGAGRMEIIDTLSSKITIKLDFLKPFEAHNMLDFTLEANGDSSTHVTWAMHGPNNFIGKIMHVFINMDQIVGKDFETGLASMKAIAEK